MRIVTIFPLPDATLLEAGRLIILFSQVEWITANVLLLSKIDAKDYAQIKDAPVVNEYLKTLLALNFGRKLDDLRRTGFDVSNLRKIGEYRNLIAHGLIFTSDTGFTAKKAAQPGSNGVDVHADELVRHIRLLEEEGGRLLDFIQARGYSYVAPQPPGIPSSPIRS